jgi:hypothetical protein
LNDVTTKHVHGQSDDVPEKGLDDPLDLVFGAILETPLDEKVAEAVDHEGVTLTDDGVDDLMFLDGCSELELLLEEEGSLLVALTDNLFNDVLPR